MPEGMSGKEKICMKISTEAASGFKDYCYKKNRTTWGMNREGERAIREYLDRVNPGWDKKKKN